VQLVGLVIPNWPLFILGTMGFFGSYMMSLQAIEQFYIEMEKIEDAKKEESEATEESEENP
jgi:TRAP-type C4-dicarboxylate transport system permease small subunit